MRTTILILLLGISVLPVYSQHYGYIDTNTSVDSTNAESKFLERNGNLTHPGQYLIKSYNSKLLSWTFMVVSGAFAYGSTKVDDPDHMFLIAGGVFSAMAIFFEVRSVILIGKAGKAMEVERLKEKKKVLSFYANPQSVGLKLTF